MPARGSAMGQGGIRASALKGWSKAERGRDDGSGNALSLWWATLWFPPARHYGQVGSG